MSRIRITGGEWRSRLIEVADAHGLRPTPDRVRETLFNWLGQNVTGLRCLDLFAGSGILGFEAASRGAAVVTMIEKNRLSFKQLQSNAILFNDARLQLISGDAVHFKPATDYDLIFLDPPYRQGLLEQIGPRLPELASSNARVYAEAESELKRLGEWRVVKQGKAGQVFYHLLERD